MEENPQNANNQKDSDPNANSPDNDLFIDADLAGENC